jgi:hypothetical protein
MPTLLNCGALCDNITPNYCVHFVCTLPLAEIYGIVHIKQQIISKGKDDKKMNKAQSKSKLTKVLSLILALVMVLSLMPLMGAASQTAGDNTASDSSDSFYRIVHLDCGRKYFTPEWIKALINEMSAAGYNQLQLAFGNKGLRLLLDDMSVTVGGKEYSTVEVLGAVNAGNKKYYDAGNKNELTQTEMTEIISYAKSKNIEIVPLFNSPFHMEALITAMTNLNASDSDESVYYGTNEACLNLDNSTAVSFVKALMQKYVNYFKNQGCKYFNFGADEYTGGWNSTFYTYAGEIASMITNAGMTPRAFNDSFRNDGNSSINGLNEVCYWYTGYTGNLYASVSSLVNSGKKIINTNKDYYYVLDSNTSKSTEYTFASSNYASNSGNWETYAKQFSNTKYNNYNTNLGNGNYTGTPAGSMFCIWCDTPRAATETQIAQQIRMILRVIGARMQNSDKYSASSVLVDGGFDADGTIYTASSTDDKSTDSGNTGDTTTTVTASENVSVAIGKEYIAETTVSGKVLTDGTTYNVKDGDTTYATYTVKHNAGTEAKAVEASSITSGEQYIIGYVSGDIQKWMQNDNGTIKYVSDPSDATKWTVTNTGNSQGGSKLYTIVSADGYTLYGNVTSGSVGLKASKTNTNSSWLSTWRWSSSDGFYIKSGGKNSSTYYICCNGSDSGSLSTNNKHGFAYTKTDATEASTTITFKGAVVTPKAIDVTIGNVKYSVAVTKEDLSQVTIPINIWITNTGVMPTGWSSGSPEEFSAAKDSDSSNLRSIYTLKANYAGVNTESGIKLESILPKDSDNGSMSGTATSWDSNDYSVEYWKNSYNTADCRQSVDDWTNNSLKGIDFEYIRYWNGEWAYSVDGKDWTTISDVGAAAADTTKNQVNIWYRQVTKVTAEVTTEMVDWGPISYSGGQCLLDFAVQYETGERTPTSFPQSGKTIGFACPTSGDAVNNGYVTNDGSYYYRTVYGIAGIETADYEVYMITVTPSSDTKSTYINSSSKSTPTSYSYSGTEKIAWAATKADAENSQLATTEDVKYGGEPFLEKVNIYQYQGLLVTYYVRAKVTADSLLVNYFKTTNKGTAQEENERIYHYNIAVNAGTYFGDVRLPETKIDNKTCLTNGKVLNKQGNSQYVSSDLSTMSAISAQYRYSSYDCYKVEVSSDHKIVNIYYTFDSAKTFVVDFGLEVVLKPSDFNERLAGEGVAITDVEVGSATTYANISVDKTTKYITYKLKQPISGEDLFSVKFTGQIKNDEGKIQSDSVEYSVTIIPATSVYYEDSFATFTDGSDAKWETVTDNVTKTSTTQALEALGEKTNVYGTDSAYSNSTKYSMGSAHKVTVTSNKASTESVTWPTASFTFTGTGFDIISLTDNTSGEFFVDVYDEDGNIVKSFGVNNYYGYKQVDGKWVVDADSTDCLYQIPVMKVSGLTYGKYTAKISVEYDEFFDVAGKSQYSFWLDAIRVYNPMANNDATYAKDGEGYPQYIKLRDEIASGTKSSTDASIVGTSKAVFIDGGNTANVATYANYGPNNEVYLANGQAITFKINPDSNIASIQIGAKAPNGRTTAKMTVTGSNDAKLVDAKELSTATEMYYEIATAGNTFTITNNGDGILSLTNLKITYSTKPTEDTSTSSDSDASPAVLTALSDEEVNTAVMSVRALFAAPVVETFEPKTFEASWNSVRKGQTATLTVKTSEDVESIMVDGVAVTDYNTRTERNGFGWWAEKVTYRVFTYTVTAEETKDYTITAFNDAGAESEPITETLTVKESGSSWWSNLWNNFFDRWF